MRIFTIGETTYDILFREGEPVGACCGGSAYNSAISLGRCSLPVSLISTFGNDPIGDLSQSFLIKNGVKCDLIKRFQGQSRIALAFIGADNNATYSFYPASMDVFPDYPIPMKNDLVLLGSSFALRDNGRDCLIAFLKQVNEARGIIIYDPNARHPMAEHPESLKKIMENISLATILKGSDQDFTNIFGLSDSRSVYSRISGEGDKILIYTKGGEGAELISADHHLEIQARKTNVISTIGAGDNFSAGIAYGIFKLLPENQPLIGLSTADWMKIMEFGTLFASEVCGSKENYITEETGKRLGQRGEF